MLRRLLACVLTSGLLAGCASTTQQPYKAPEGQSVALSAARAAGLLGLKDGDSSVGAAINTGTGLPIVGTLPGAVAFGALSAVSPPPGFGSGAAGALGFAAMFFSGPDAEAASRYTQVLAWPPKDFAPDAASAQAKINALFAQELAAVLADAPLSAGYRIEKREEEKTRYKSTGGLLPDLNPERFIAKHTDFVLRGGECDDPKLVCRYSINAGIPPAEGVAPAFMGGYPAWTWTRASGLITIAGTAFDGRGLVKTYRPMFPDIEVYRRLSARLPDWVYIYVAPYSAAYWNDDAGQYRFTGYPVVFHHGNAELFVRKAKN